MKTKQNKTKKEGLPSRPDEQRSAAPALDNQKATPSEHWRGIFFQGPEPAQDRQTGDEIPTWTVFVGNHDADPRGKVYTVYSFSRAQSLAQAMATDRNLQLIAEAQPADLHPRNPHEYDGPARTAEQVAA